MKRILQLLSCVGRETIIIFLYILLLNNYLGNPDKTIYADGRGYYEYLPSLFIYHDLHRKNSEADVDTALYQRISKHNFYVDYNGYKVNKYPCGTAVLELPFFLFAYFTTPLENNDLDGYQRPFQIMVFYAAIFYLFLALLFLAGILRLFNINKVVIFLVQLLFVFSTGILHYASNDAAYSHVYSLFAITAFVYYSKAFFISGRRKDFLYASLFLGLILILRQIHILIIFFIPFLAASFESLKSRISILWNIKSVLLSLLIVIGVFSIQAVSWYLQTGHFIVYSYQGEGFNFLKPEIFNFLISYRKGLFVYSPVLLLSALGIIFLLYRKEYYLVITWLLFFLVLIYVLSSWHAWHYGCSFGQRPIIDFYVVFFILIGILFNKLSGPARIILIILSLMTIPVNIIQTYQYKNYILHWLNMDDSKYWDVFLKTSEKYEGLVWKKKYDYSHFNLISEFSIGNIRMSPNEYETIFEVNTDTLADLNGLEIIQVSMKNEFPDNNNSYVFVTVFNNDDKSEYYWYKRSLISFKEEKFGEYHTGVFNFRMKPVMDTIKKTILVEFEGDDSYNKLDDVKVLFLKHK